MEDRATPPGAPAEGSTDAIREALLSLVQDVVHSLPSDATLGQLVEQLETRDELRPVLEVLTVQHILEWGKSRPRPEAPPATSAADEDGVYLDEDGNYTTDLIDGTGAVVRRKADVEEGNLSVLSFLSKAGAHTELSITRGTRLDGDQVRLVVRHLRKKGLIYSEGSGAKRRNRITRAGTSFLTKHGR